MTRNLITPFLTFIAFSLVTVSSCSAQTEEQALESLRQMTKDGKFPAESVVENFERRFSGRPSGVLARLLRARIKFENKDFAGAASLLNSDDFANKTKVGDYALWLRGQALQAAGNSSDAVSAYEKLERAYPSSIHLTDAKLKQAEASIQAGRPVSFYRRWPSGRPIALAF